MTAVVLYRVDPSRNMRRFYRLDVHEDLFGVWLLVREWGCIGRSGRTRIASFATIDAAQDAMLRQRRSKERRGYADTAHDAAGQSELRPTTHRGEFGWNRLLSTLS
jgi:predicted DNA-binding WGR domain protein